MWSAPFDQGQREKTLFLLQKCEILIFSGLCKIKKKNNDLFQKYALSTSRTSTFIGAKPNLYCETIELVCGGSPKVCVLIEWKSRHRVKSEQWQLKLVWISCLSSTSVQSWMKSMVTIYSSYKSLYSNLPLYKDHKIRRATAGEPTLLE